MKKALDNFVLIFILFIPFLYLYISYGFRINVDLESLSTLFFSIFFFICFIYLYKNNIAKRLLEVFILYVLIAMGYMLFNKINIFDNLSNVLGIFYFPIFALFFSNYDNKWISKKYISYIFLIFTSILTISYIYKFNLDLEIEYKKGFIGLLYNGNIISPILITLLPIAMLFTYNSKSYIIKGLFYITTIVSLIMVGTKTILLGCIIYFIIIALKYFKKKPHVALILATVFTGIVVVLPLIPQYQNFRTTRIYDMSNNDNKLSVEYIDKKVFGHRIEESKPITKYYLDSPIMSKLFGVEFIRTEIDFIDILLTIGIVGVILYLVMMYVVIKNSPLKGIYNVIFIIMIFASCIQGNIFTNPLVYIFIALLFSINRIKDDNKKNILLVSNMYPTINDQSYGIFVKNTYEALLTQYNVDKVVIGKHNNVLIKLLAYIYLHLLTIIKMTFNNYDYVYVHYISHSSIGPIIGDILSKNVKIIYNAHGNDVIADSKRDLKNIERSKRYLKRAYKVVVPSEYYKEVMVDEYKIPEKKVFVYPSGGVDVNLFTDMDSKKAREQLGLEKKNKYIGYISRIDKDKGYDTFIEAINILVKDKKYKNYKYIIVGDGKEKKILNSLINQYNLQDSVILYDKVSREELVYLYNSLDIFVFPTRRVSDSLGLVGIEALACETITITSDARGPKSYMNGKNGYTFKQDSYEDLVKTINKVNELDKDHLDKLRKAGRKTALAYSSDNTIDILKKVFR